MLGLAWSWHHIAGSGAAQLGDRLKQVAQVGFDFASHLATQGLIDPAKFEAQALAKCQEQLDHLGIPAKDAIMGVVKHELDLLVGEMYRNRLPAELDEVAQRVQAMKDSMESDVKRWQAAEAALVAKSQADAAWFAENRSSLAQQAGSSPAGASDDAKPPPVETQILNAMALPDQKKGP